MLDNILLSPFNMQYQLEAIHYILFITLEKYFKKAMHYQKKNAWIKSMSVRLPLYQKWPTLLQTQRCALFKADIIL